MSHNIVIFTVGHGMEPFVTRNGSTMEWFGIKLSVTDSIGSNVISACCLLSCIAPKIESPSFMLISVVGTGSVIGRMELRWISSSVLLSNLYPFVAVLLGAEVVVRLFVESVLRSIIPLVVRVDWLFCVVLPPGLAVVVLFAVVRGVVEVVIVPVVLLGIGVYDDDVFCALGSVKWLLMVTSRYGNAVVTTSEWELEQSHYVQYLQFSKPPK